MIKKMQKISLLFAAALAVSAFSGCKENATDTDEPEKKAGQTQITVGYYDGGLGRDWIRACQKAYMEKHPDIYVMIKYDKSRYESSKLLAAYNSYDEDIFLVDQAVNEYYTEGYYYDITKAVSTPLSEYGETESILDKLNDSYVATYNKDGKYYAMPYYEAFYSLIYDVRLFEKKGFYLDGYGGYTSGSNKSAGKDGVPGTYDDGLPATTDEFFALCKYMLEKGVTPFTFSGQLGYYHTKMLESFCASYEGYDDYLLNYTLNSNGREYMFANGEKTAITRENAWRLKTEAPGKKAALEFADAIINGYGGSGANGAFCSDQVWATGQDHLQAQNEFIFSEFTGKPVAFLIDGTWWEREAKSAFDSLVKRTKDQSDAYGKRKFGVMPLPTQHDDGKGKESVFSGVTGSQIFINKNTSQAKEAIDFFRYLHSDEALSLMTSRSNTLRPFDYKIANNDKENMTYFSAQISDLLHSGQAAAKTIPDMVVDPCFQNTEFFTFQKWTFGSTYGSYPLQLMHDYGYNVSEYLAAMSVDCDKWTQRIAAWNKD